MMYDSKLAIALKVNGNVVREDKDKVYLPFGSEYSLYIKNLNSKRAIVRISIDGTDVSTGGFIVDANSAVEIERFVKDNDQGNRFKFIERTGAIEDHRGIGIEDGLIRVEFQYEKERPIIMWNDDTFRPKSDGWDRKGGYDGRRTTTGNNPQMYNSTTTSDSMLRSKSVSRSVTTSGADVSYSTQTNDAGITVPGSISDQKFTTVSSFPLEDTKHVIVMKVLGVTPEKEPVKVVVETRSNPVCNTCGKKNRSSYKFCGECGTSLIVY